MESCVPGTVIFFISSVNKPITVSLGLVSGQFTVISSGVIGRFCRFSKYQGACGRGSNGFGHPAVVGETPGHYRRIINAVLIGKTTSPCFCKYLQTYLCLYVDSNNK